MKRIEKHLSSIILIFIFLPFFINAQINQNWTTEEFNLANTVNGIDYLNDIEKEAVIILNLARLYPKKFIELELKNFNGTPKYGEYLINSKYKTSLINELLKTEPMIALSPDKNLTANANCFAIEMGKRGYQGHKRLKCPKENYSECCSYGMETGKEIIMQLLIDHNVPFLGHRKICLDKTNTKIGIAVAKHKKWETGCVLEMI